MSLKGFSLFRSGIGWFDARKDDVPEKRELSPSVTLQLDKETYRPGDTVIATIEICSRKISKECSGQEQLTGTSFLVDNLAFEIKGVEKLDSQWFATPKPLPPSKQTRGEHLFLDTTAPSIVSKVVLSSGSTKTYVVRVDLPKILPPSYRGISIRYIYYVRTTVFGRWLVLENHNYNRGSINNSIQVESRTPLQIWASQKSHNLLNEEGGFLSTADQLEIYWKEKDADSEWVRACENSEVLEDGYDSSKDEVSSVSSYNPIRGQYDVALRNSLSMQSIASRLSNNDFQVSQGERSGFPSYMPITQLSVAEVLDDASGGLMAPQNNLYSLSASFPSQQRANLGSNFPKGDVVGSPYASKSNESPASEGFVRGRSYNIRIDDQVLLRFSPKNSDSTYYFGDTIGGTLTFFPREGARRCLEVSVTLEISETIAPHLVHPSRRGSSTITKVLSEHHEAVSDLVQTSFLFSIPIDGPMSFSTPKVSVKWSLRFEFFTTPKDLDLSRYEHPLLVEQREKGDWVLPITVYAPPLRAQAAQSRNDKSVSLGGLFNN